MIRARALTIPKPTIRHRRPVTISPRVQIAGAVLLALWFGAFLGMKAHATMEANRLRDAVCEARLDAFTARNPVLAKGLVRSWRPCADLASMSPDLVPPR